MLLPALYDTVILKSSRTCKITLLMLSQNRYLCGFIRKLAVRPNYYLSWPRPDELLDERWVVDMIKEIADGLTSMHTFDWDGLELPKDCLWDTLRLLYVTNVVVIDWNNNNTITTSPSCPQLKSVFSNVGHWPLNPNSSLFKFRGLTSFSLIIRHGLGGSGTLLVSQAIIHYRLPITPHRIISGSRRSPSPVLGHAPEPLSRPPRTRDLQLLLFLPRVRL